MTYIRLYTPRCTLHILETTVRFFSLVYSLQLLYESPTVGMYITCLIS
jgi:hypothetical protein